MENDNISVRKYGLLIISLLILNDKSKLYFSLKYGIVNINDVILLT